MSENTISQQPNLFAADSLAKMSVLQEKEKGLKVRGQPSGQNSIVSFAKFSPDGSLLKMYQGFYQATMESFAQKYLESFPRAGIMLNGMLYQPINLEPNTYEEGSLLWLTPTVFDSHLRPNTAPNQTLSFQVRFQVWNGLRYATNRMEVQEMGIKLPIISQEHLNPVFVEQLMGFPEGWTELED